MKCPDCLVFQHCLIHGLRNAKGLLDCEGLVSEPEHQGIIEIIEYSHDSVVAKVEGCVHRLRMIVKTTLKAGDKCIAVYDLDKMTLGVLCEYEG